MLHTPRLLLSGVIVLTWQDTWEQITPLTALVSSGFFNKCLHLLPHLLLLHCGAGERCCHSPTLLPLLSSDKPTRLCLRCCRCQLIPLLFSFCRWKMHWARQIFSSSWTCTLLIANNSKCCFKAQLVIQGFVHLGNRFDEVRALCKKGIALISHLALVLKSFCFFSLFLKCLSYSFLKEWRFFSFKCEVFNSVKCYLSLLWLKPKEISSVTSMWAGAVVQNSCISGDNEVFSGWRWLYEHDKYFSCIRN